MNTDAKVAATFLGVAAGNIAFMVSLLIPLPLLWYLPEARHFEWGTSVDAVGIDFYGRVGLSLICGGVIGGLGGWVFHGLSRRGHTLTGARQTLGGWALSTVWIAAFVIVLSLATRPVGPGTLP